METKETILWWQKNIEQKNKEQKNIEQKTNYNKLNGLIRY